MTFSDLKKRLVDCLIHAGEAEATAEKVRLWSCQSKDKLLKSYKAITQGNSQETQENEDVERNTGVEFPGQSLEPLVGTNMTVDEKEFKEEVVFVEYGHPGFTYQYMKQDRVVIG
jgi:hypothetical protein